MECEKDWRSFDESLVIFFPYISRVFFFFFTRPHSLLCVLYPMCKKDVERNHVEGHESRARINVKAFVLVRKNAPGENKFKSK